MLFRSSLCSRRWSAPRCCCRACWAAKKPLVRWELPLGLSFGFQADALAVFMAMTSSLVASLILIYSFGYIKEYDNQNEYYLMAVLFLGAMMGLVYSTSLLAIYIFWEISAVCCWRLIGFYREELTIQRANKAFIVHRARRADHARGLYRRLEPDRHVRTHRHEGHTDSRLVRVSDPCRHLHQICDFPAAQLAAGRGRCALSGDVAAATRQCWSKSAFTRMRGCL